MERVRECIMKKQKEEKDGEKGIDQSAKKPWSLHWFIRERIWNGKGV